MKKKEELDPYWHPRGDELIPPSHPHTPKKYSKKDREINKKRIEKEIEQWEDEIPEGVEIL